MPLPGAEPALLTLNALKVRLRSIAKILWIPWTLQLAFGLVWLEGPVSSLLGGMLLAVPFVGVIVLAVTHLESRWARTSLLAVLSVTNYAQYAFASFYGRFIGSGELALMASNSATELARSVRLYFSPMALLASLAIAIAYAFLPMRSHATVRRTRWATFCVLTAIAWGIGTDGFADRLPTSSPEMAFVQAQWRAASSRMHRWLHGGWVRNAAPRPDHAPAPFDIIYLIGESLRADRFPGGHYARHVTPYLDSLTLPHVTYANVTSHGDCTGRSVPYLMVSPVMPFFRTLYTQPTLFDYAKGAGFRTSFIYSNENEWLEFRNGSIDNLQQHVEFTSGMEEWNYRSDHSMLESIGNSANQPGRQFLVIETYTSHWPYGERYQTCTGCRIYRPDNVGRPVPFSSAYRTQIVNSYDNALVYFDQFVSKLVTSLKKPTLIVLTSDHAESLGERGMWGHCSGQPEQFSVPLMVIATDKSVADAAGFAALAENVDTPVSHANIFPTLLEYLGYSPGLTGYRYSSNLLHVNAGAAKDRQVLVSEIGSGIEPVEFSHVDAHGAITSRQSIAPSP